jgi:hypothetical protein
MYLNVAGEAWNVFEALLRHDWKRWRVDSDECSHGCHPIPGAVHRMDLVLPLPRLLGSVVFRHPCGCTFLSFHKEYCLPAITCNLIA